MTTPFVHLHVHSAYSLAEGAIRIEQLASLCRDSRMPAVAVTDTDNLFGALEASSVLGEAGVQPIVGVHQTLAPGEFGLVGARGERGPALVLLAQDEAGYERLMALSSRAFLQPAGEDGPAAALGWFEELGTDGLICLTGGFDGPVDALFRAGRDGDAAAALDRLSGLFPDRLYVEIHRHEARRALSVENRLLGAAYDKELPIVAANEAFFASAGDHEAHDALLCVAGGAYVHQDDRRKVTPDHYFKSAEEMAALFADLPEAIENTAVIARRCAVRPRFRDPILPRFAADGG